MKAILAAILIAPMRGDDISTLPAPNRRAADSANDHQHADARSRMRETCGESD